MTEVCWGTLAKYIDDKTTVSEEIDADILLHNNDPSSHSQANESLYNHRIAEILDHLDESIINLKLTYPVRAYNAIVASDGSGDYTDIQTAINAVNNAGGGNILIRAGIYNLTDNITLYDNIELVGEGANNTILNFTVDEKNVQIQGVERTPIYDTFSISKNSSTLTAVNSDFLTTVEVGDFVYLQQVSYEIESVDSNTQLTLKYLYRGDSIVDSPDLVIMDYITDFTISNLSIRNCTGSSTGNGSGMFMYHIRNFRLSNVLIYNNEYCGFAISDGYNGVIENCVVINNRTYGAVVSHSQNVNINNVYAIANQGSGFLSDGTTTMHITYLSCTAAQNLEHGFYLGNAVRIVVLSCNTLDNGLDGVNIYQGDYMRVADCSVMSNDRYGIRIGHAYARKNIISNNICLENVSTQISDIGTETILDNNVTTA